MRQFLFLLFLSISVSVKAQFYWGFPQQQWTEQKQEKYTAPTYKKGDSDIQAFVQKNFKQPVEHEKVDGKIVIAVIVNTKGKPTETQVVRSLTKSLDAEAIRVCQKMKFKPATLGKKKVKGRIDITIPIKHGRLSYLDLPTIEV